MLVRDTMNVRTPQRQANSTIHTPRKRHTSPAHTHTHTHGCYGWKNARRGAAGFCVSRSRTGGRVLVRLRRLHNTTRGWISNYGCGVKRKLQRVSNGVVPLVPRFPFFVDVLMRRTGQESAGNRWEGGSGARVRAKVCTSPHSGVWDASVATEGRGQCGAESRQRAFSYVLTHTSFTQTMG